MSFDGDESHTGAIVYPLAYHSKGRCVPTVPAYALANAYYLARKKNRILVQQTYPANMPNLNLLAGTTEYFLPVSATAVRAFDALVDLPSEANMLRCVILVAVGATGDTTIVGRLHTYDGSSTENGDVVTQTVAGASSPAQAGSTFEQFVATSTPEGQRHLAAGMMPGAGEMTMLELTCSTAEAGTAGLEIYATLTVTNADGLAFAVRPVWASVWWECVET